MDASGEFQVFMSPTSKWRDQTQGIKQRIVPVISNILPSNGFSLNNRAQNIYKAVSGVSFQETEYRGRKKKHSKKEQLGDKKSESEPSIFRWRKEQFTMTQIYKQMEATDTKKDSMDSNHKRSNSTKRKPSFEFRHKDLTTIPITSNMEPNKIARTSSKKERFRSSSQARVAAPLADRTNSFEFPIRPRRARSSSRSRKSMEEIGFINPSKESSKKSPISTKGQYSSQMPWKNIDIIRNVDDLRIKKEKSNSLNSRNSTNESYENSVSKYYSNETSTSVTTIKSSEPSNDSQSSKYYPSEQFYTENDNISCDFDQCYEANSSSEVIFVSQTLEIDPGEISNSNQFQANRAATNEPPFYVSTTSVQDIVYHNPSQNNTNFVNVYEVNSPNTQSSLTNVIEKKDDTSVSILIKDNSSSVIENTYDNCFSYQPEEGNVISIDLMRNRNGHEPLKNKSSLNSVLSAVSSDYDYIAEVTGDLDPSDDEDVSMYSTFIPNSAVEEDSFVIKPILPRVNLQKSQNMTTKSHESTSSSNGSVDSKTRSQSFCSNVANCKNSKFVSLNQIILPKDSHKSNEKNNFEIKRHSWLNSFVSKDQFEKDQKISNWSYSEPLIHYSSKNSPELPHRVNKSSFINDSSIYTESIDFDEEENYDYPEPLYAPIYVSPSKENSPLSVTPPKTFKDFLRDSCFNPPETESEFNYNDDTYLDKHSLEKFSNEISAENFIVNSRKSINDEMRDDRSCYSWLEASSEFEFVNVRDDESSSEDELVLQLNKNCLNKLKNNENERNQLPPFPTLSSLQSSYSPENSAQLASGITL